MQSFSRGWNFLMQAWKMAFADGDLIKPSLYALVMGFVITCIGAVPIILAALVFGFESLLGRIVLGVLGALLVFAQYAVTYIFSAMTIYLIFGYLSEGDGRMDKAWAVVRRDWLDILTLAAASTLVNILQNMVRGNGRSRNFFREQLASLIQTLWTEATYLVLPIMVIEDVGLKDGLKRATYIAKNNLLLIGISTVGVRWVTGLVGFILTLIGLGLGLGTSFLLISLAGSSTLITVLAVLLGIFTASIFFMAASVISTYTATAYHTCLYLWARGVETAGQSISAPAPLAVALGY